MKKDRSEYSGIKPFSSMYSMKSRIEKKDIEIDDRALNTWQSIVDIVADIIAVPAALIMKIDLPYIEVFRSSRSNNNPYKAGKRTILDGLYCEEVIKGKEKLLVANALKDNNWKNNPDIKSGMISYLGFPLIWPDQEVFGTICVLDSKENRYNEQYEQLILLYKELIESHIALYYYNAVEMRNLEGVLDNLTEGIIAHDRHRTILFFNRAAERITGYYRDEVLGNDCHKAFGTPFCGGRCSFCENDFLDSWEDVEYPLNIITRQGKSRRIEMKVTGMYDGDGRFEGVISVFRDVTDLVGIKIQHGELNGFAGIIGRDPKMLQVYRHIRELATSDYPVHISGETGTGKELVAAAIHNESRRGGKPFVPVNCGALPEGILESELFGHVKGAFSGAVRDKKGRFGLAHTGTLFLDEVSDLSKVVQAKLLRVLQEGSFERVGGEKTITVDVRIISATNKDLKREVEKNNFRDDLYYRINVVPIRLPPLRERKSDIPLLVEHFLKEAVKEGQKTSGISKEALAIIQDYAWPGNVRELQSAIRFALVRSRGQIIMPENLPIELQKWESTRFSRGPSRKLDKETVKDAMIQSGGNKSKAAKILGVGRATLYRFLADFPDVL
jgi:PAS domain S-box-containing protein